MKKIRICFVIFLIMLGLTACGSPDNSNKLAHNAKQEHGSAKVVSKSKTSDGYTVTLHDDLQDFDYTVTSYMHYTYFDGVKIGTGSPVVVDEFQACLVEKILADEQTEIDNIKQKYGAKVSANRDPIIFVNAPDPDSAKQAAQEIAELFQQNNLNNRLLGLEIEVESLDSYYHDRTGYTDQPEKTLGYYTLPAIDWYGEDQELIDMYTILAQEMDPGAYYLRSEIWRLCDTGYDMDMIAMTNAYPRFPNAPVTLYFFESSDGKEFYIADFYLYYENDRTQCYEANNYKDRK